MSAALRTCCGEQGCTATPERPCFCDCHQRDDVLRPASDLSTVPCRRCGAPEGHSRHLFEFCEYSPHDPRCIRLTGAPDVREFCDCRVWQMLDGAASQTSTGVDETPNERALGTSAQHLRRCRMSERGSSALGPQAEGSPPSRASEKRTTTYEPKEPVVTAPQVDEWSILLTVKEPLTKEQRSTIFTAICEATLPLQDTLGVEIDASGQPLEELLASDLRLEAALARAEAGGWFTLSETATVGGLAQFVTMLVEHPESVAAGGTS